MGRSTLLHTNSQTIITIRDNRCHFIKVAMHIWWMYLFLKSYHGVWKIFNTEIQGSLWVASNSACTSSVCEIFQSQIIYMNLHWYLYNFSLNFTPRRTLNFQLINSKILYFKHRIFFVLISLDIRQNKHEAYNLVFCIWLYTRFLSLLHFTMTVSSFLCLANRFWTNNHWLPLRFAIKSVKMKSICITICKI